LGAPILKKPALAGFLLLLADLDLVRIYLAL